MGELKDWCWMHYEKYIMIEYLQCKKEGLIVDDLKPLCEYVGNNYGKIDVKQLGEDLERQLHSCKKDENFKYAEPSTYDEIIQELKPSTFIKKELSNDDIKNHIKGAWIGRLAGCLLGKPLEGWRSHNIIKMLKETNNYPLSRYISKKDFSKELIDSLWIDVNSFWIDNLKDASFNDDDTTYTVLALKNVLYWGRNFTSYNVLETWLRFLPMVITCTAERIAFRNAASGLLPPFTATHQNPYREYIGAQIRGDFYGYININNPKEAAKMAFNDASISHTKNGIYGEMFVSSLNAIAPCYDNMETIILKALEQIPYNSRFHEEIMLVINDYKNNVSEEDNRKNIQKRYNENIELEWGYVLSNAAIVAHGLLYGKNDFALSIGYAIMCGFDTDCNGATVGSVIGMFLGAKKIPSYWYESFKSKLYTSVEGYNLVDIETLVNETLKCLEQK